MSDRVYSDGEIEKWQRRLVCARCYGDLAAVLVSKQGEPHAYILDCPECGEAWGGAVMSRSAAERRGQQALSDLMDVRYNLPDLFPNPNKGKTEQQLLAELGF